jgi:ribosomal protein S18 acetylase RimI-like enzyme
MEAYGDQRQEDVANLFATFGLRPARYFFDMMYEGGSVPLDPGLPAGWSTRPFAWGEDEEVAWRVLDTSFRDHWGHTPLTYEHWLHWIRTGPFEADLVTLAEAPDGEVGGVCLCLIDHETNERRGRNEGWIDALGVLREHRRQGIGRALLVKGMECLHRRGCTHLLLGVDTENPTGALGLYESVGFEKWKVGIAYQKRLRG